MVNLDDAYAKHDRALHHFHKLHVAFEEYLDGNFIATSESPALGARLKPPAPGMVLGALLKLDLKAQPSRVIAAVIGDCVQNLRASLDYLVFSLARLAHAGKPPRTRTQFPISTDVGRYFTTGRYQVRPLDGMHRQVIRRLQPYQYGPAATDRSLAVLNRLSNQDKHRLLITTALVLEGLIVRTNHRGGGVKAIPNYMRESDEVEKMKLDPKVSAIVPIQLQVKDGREMRDVFETLPGLGNDIRDILDWFRPVF